MALFRDSWNDRCFFCEKYECDAFTVEWDADVHEECVWVAYEKGSPEAEATLQEWGEFPCKACKSVDCQCVR